MELRTAELLVPEWFAMLRRRGVAHCFNSWHRMPPIGHQHRLFREWGGDGAPIRLLRLLTPPGMAYAASVERFSPYDELVEEAADVRAEAIEIVLDGLRAGAEAVVIANNRLEGNSPKTIDALGRALLKRLESEP